MFPKHSPKATLEQKALEEDWEVKRQQERSASTSSHPLSPCDPPKTP